MEQQSSNAEETDGWETKARLSAICHDYLYAPAEIITSVLDILFVRMSHVRPFFFFRFLSEKILRGGPSLLLYPTEKYLRFLLVY